MVSRLEELNKLIALDSSGFEAVQLGFQVFCGTQYNLLVIDRGFVQRRHRRPSKQVTGTPASMKRSFRITCQSNGEEEGEGLREIELFELVQRLGQRQFRGYSGHERRLVLLSPNMHTRGTQPDKSIPIHATKPKYNAPISNLNFFEQVKDRDAVTASICEWNFTQLSEIYLDVQDEAHLVGLYWLAVLFSHRKKLRAVRWRHSISRLTLTKQLSQNSNCYIRGKSTLFKTVDKLSTILNFKYPSTIQSYPLLPSFFNTSKIQSYPLPPSFSARYATYQCFWYSHPINTSLLFSLNVVFIHSLLYIHLLIHHSNTNPILLISFSRIMPPKNKSNQKTSTSKEATPMPNKTTPKSKIPVMIL
ncbi:hypothetical protein VP01_1664g1 [Puccinia sorghi]|uniref:Uncharacterized protein n=1 Tax=Puccinia sorghi TaxID=27349 RepID=A0A0L6VGS3_9BASI|nr:hypothetical protein VP01_1664g1 [Puccinia sorghi]